MAVLLEKHPDLDASRSSDGATPLYVAWSNKHGDIVKLLLTVSTPCVPVSLLGTEKNSMVTLEILKSAASGSSTTGTIRLTTSKVHSLDPELLRLVLGRLNFANLKCEWAAAHAPEFLAALSKLLLFAASKDDIPLATLLLDSHRIDPDSCSIDQTPLLAALGKGNREMARLLLSRSADPNIVLAGQPTPLQLCISRSDVEGVKLLLMAGANANLIGSPGSSTVAGQSPLRIALSARNEKISHILLSAGAVDQQTVSTHVSLTNRDLSALQLSDEEAARIPCHDSSTVVSLNLSSNLLQRLDTRAWRYPLLATLRLTSNKLVETPRGLSLLSQLTYLDLSGNSLSDLTSLCHDHPPKLSALILRNNPLPGIPLWMHRLSALQELEFDTSSTFAIPLSIQRLPTAELLGFLRATESKSIRWNTAKVWRLSSKAFAFIRFLR